MKTQTASKKLGLITMLSICMGLVVVQGAMISALQGMGIGGLGFFAALLIAFILAQCYVLSFSELALMFPSAGTLATYTQKAMGHFPAIVAVFSGYVVVAMFGLGAELILLDAVLDTLFPNTIPHTLIPLSILLILTVLNILGTDVFAKVQNLFTFGMVLILLFVGITAAFGLSNLPLLDPKVSINWEMRSILNGDFLGLVALAMWLMVGAEFICPLILEVKNPSHNIPRVMMLSLTFILLIFMIFCIGASRYLPIQTLTTSNLPHLEYIFAIFGPSAKFIMLTIAITATCSTVNTVLASVSRMIFGMAQNGQAFPQLKICHSRFKTPWVAIVFVASSIAVPFILMGPESLIILLISASISWLLAYIIAHLNVIILRYRHPELVRPFRSPFFPMPQIIGILGMVYVIIHNSPSPEMSQTIYFLAGGVLILVSTIAALWVKLMMKRQLFKPDLN